MSGLLSGIWLYRHFILSSIRNEFTIRFARSKLGGLWMILNPLAQVVIYALILSNVLAAKLPGIENKYAYAIYLMSGMLAWNLFSEIIGRCLGLFVEQGNLMKKMNFPRICLPVIVLGSCLTNNLLLFVSMAGIFLLLGHSFSASLLLLAPLTLLVVALGLGIGMLFGVLNVFVRDLGQVVPILLQVWFWFTPIVYPPTIIPEQYRPWLNLNPMATLTQAYQQILVYRTLPELGSVFPVAAGGLFMLLLSFFLFRRASAEMVDVL